jgi:hypothetical protein
LGGINLSLYFFLFFLVSKGLFGSNEGRGGILMEGRGREGRGCSLIKYMFGSKEERGGEVRYFN